jgi:hypothetical protein
MNADKKEIERREAEKRRRRRMKPNLPSLLLSSASQRSFLVFSLHPRSSELICG